MANLSVLIHGDSGTGKSWLADTMPAPRLLLDIEGGHQFTRSTKVHWDVALGGPPPATTDTCIATIKNLKALSMAQQWLQSGKHPFVSVGLDSLSELQKRLMDELVGTESMQMQDWGTVLRRMEGLVRSFRDLTISNGKPGMRCVAIITGSKTTNEGKTIPLIQGQLSSTIPYYMDVVGYLYLTQDPEGGIKRNLLVSPVGPFVAKDRTGRFSTVISNPNLSDMLAELNEEKN